MVQASYTISVDTTEVMNRCALAKSTDNSAGGHLRVPPDPINAHMAGACSSFMVHQFPAPAAVSPLFGCPDMQYVMPTHIGNGRYNLVPDLCSSAIVVFDKSCQSCPPVIPGFMPDLSMNFSGYADISYSAGDGYGPTFKAPVAAQNAPWVAQRILSIRMGNTIGSFMRSCADWSTIRANNNFDGVFGLYDVPRNLMGSFGISSMSYLQGSSAKLPALMVGFQFCNQGGYLTWGGVARNSVVGNVSFLDLEKGRYDAVIAANGMQIDGSDALHLQAASKLSLRVDTGAPKLYLNEPWFTSLIQSLRANAHSDIDTSFLNDRGGCLPYHGFSAEDIDAAFAPLTLLLSDRNKASLNLTLPASQSYLVPYAGPGNDTFWCNAVSKTYDTPTLGTALLRSLILIYDQGSQRVGFALQNTSTCPIEAALPPLGTHFSNIRPPTNLQSPQQLSVPESCLLSALSIGIVIGLICIPCLTRQGE